MNRLSETRVYACGILPFFVLFSVVALRADLVLVSVGLGDVSSRSGGDGSGNKMHSQHSRENTTNLSLICPFLVIWRGGGPVRDGGVGCVVVWLGGKEGGYMVRRQLFIIRHIDITCSGRARSREGVCADRFPHASWRLPRYISGRLAVKPPTPSAPLTVCARNIDLLPINPPSMAHTPVHLNSFIFPFHPFSSNHLQVLVVYIQNRPFQLAT